ncbi:MFS transporter [Seleniivibrio woodruffii]|uniref:MFS transporter n=1 Tax=Seleniivibrio woodruffii TaxID=1078050 RepID=UPI0026F1A0DA|nr:MFS transporter [Seleniivibrio woodruffii]
MSDERVTLKSLLLIGSLYLTQYMGFSFFLEALVAIMRKNGATLQSISAIYLLGVFWLLKFLWAPVIDRFSPVRRWKYKGWLMMFQIAMAVVFIATAMLNVIDDMKMIIVMGMLMGFFSSTQDVVADAMVYRLLSTKERSIGNSVKTAGTMLGWMLGSGVGLIVYSRVGWQSCLYILAGVMLLSFVQILFFKEPYFPPHKTAEVSYWRYFIQFWRSGKRLNWLVILIIFPMGYTAVHALMTPVLVDSGIRLDVIGFIVNFMGTAIGALSAFMAGSLLKRFGKKTILVGFAAMHALVALLLFIPVTLHGNTALSAFCVFMIMGAAGPAAAIFYTIMMEYVSNERPATDFAMQHSIYLFISFFSGSVATACAGRYGYGTVLVSLSGLSLIAAFASALLYRPAVKSVPVPEFSTAES